VTLPQVQESLQHNQAVQQQQQQLNHSVQQQQQQQHNQAVQQQQHNQAVQQQQQSILQCLPNRLEQQLNVPSADMQVLLYYLLCR
jgi:tRNA U34 5-carboxymethylaminomethyl modifying GTPase MnmE/TrmE